MRRKIITILIITMVIAGLILTACGKKDQAINEVMQSPKSSERTKTEDSSKSRGDKKSNDKKSDTESVNMYEAFLSGEERTGISRINLNSYMYDEQEATIDSNKRYTMEELLKVFFENRLESNNNNYIVDGLEYAYVDMGRDGERELVLHFISKCQYDEYSNIMIIKNVNHKLELCYFTEDGYRSYNYVNLDGIVAFGGSGGASVWYDCYKTLDSNGDVVFLLDREIMGAYDIYINGEGYGDVAEKLGVADDISITRYLLEGFDGDYDDGSYDEYLNKAYYTYEQYGDGGEMTTSSEIYEKTSKYAKFMNLISDNVHSYDDMQNILTRHLQEYNLTEEMLKENDPKWVKWEGHDELFESTNVPTDVFVVDNPSWEYFVTDYPYEVGVDDCVTLSEISHKSNNITDDEKWFNEIGIEVPENGIINDPGFEYTYELTSQYGQYSHEYDTVKIHNNYTERDEAILDFSNYITPDEIAVGDAAYVKECVNYVQAIDNVLYVSIAHRTYAASASHNAYIVALDMNHNYKVIWKSEPLTCNSNNFAIVDGSIICGYGFTDEPDYIYTLNRYTGKRMEQIKVKTGPDYFYAIDGKLYVRTYDTDYVYQLSWG